MWTDAMERASILLIPEHMRESVKDWIVRGWEPGSFLTAILTNDLFLAYGSADDINRHYIGGFVHFFWNYAPSACWGSREKMTHWMELRRTDNEHNNT